jgi:hypothetical protein
MSLSPHPQNSIIFAFGLDLKLLWGDDQPNIRVKG